jgi:hypothetical protein
VEDKTQCTNLRDLWYTRLMESNRAAALPLKRPGRFGKGWTMTLALVEQSSWMAETSDGRLDMAATLTNLRSAEQLIDTTVSKWRPSAAIHPLIIPIEGVTPSRTEL